MAATLISEDADELVIQIRIRKSSDFPRCEDLIQDALNDAGRLATRKCLERFDTDGSPIIAAGRKLTAKRTKIARKYETPYGTVAVGHLAYQTPQGGQVFIPLEHNARIIGGTTPRFARIVSYNYSHNNAGAVQANLLQILNRKVSRSHIQDISAAVATHVEDKSRVWDYASSEPKPAEVTVVAIGIDGTCLISCEEGFRQAMVGTVAFYGAEGTRLHTNHVAAAPEHGKASFLERMEEEAARIKRKFPHARYVGISDGAADYLKWLRTHTTTRVLHFWHDTDYIHAGAVAVHSGEERRQQWIEETCHALKHEHGAAARILGELREASERKQPSKAGEALRAACRSAPG